jgi:hypothetical protein
VASAYAQYYIFAYVLFAVFCVLTSGLIYVTALTFSDNLPIQLIFEAVLGVILIRLVILFCNRIVFSNGGELAHPVLWTWYSTYLLILYLIRGILSGIVRMVTMFVWIVIQIGIIHRSNFPEGKECRDPAFSSFFQTLNFHHRCTPVFRTGDNQKDPT